MTPYLHQLLQFTHQIFPRFLQLVQPELKLNFSHPKTFKFGASPSSRARVLLHIGHCRSILPQPRDFPHDLGVFHLELVDEPSTVLLLLPLRALPSFSALLSPPLSSSNSPHLVFRARLQAS